MAAPLADLHIALVLRCTPNVFRLPLAQEHYRKFAATERRVECGRVCFADDQGFASPDTAEVIFDPWLHSGFVVYGDQGMHAAGPDLQSVVYNWLPRAQAGGF